MALPFPPGLVVSCQALEDEPLHGAEIMAKMSKAAEQGGAVAIRANGSADIVAIRAVVHLPVIGIFKVHYSDSPVYITPTAREVDAVLYTGAEVVSLDATDRKRPSGAILEELVARIHGQGRLAMADISTLDEALRAESIGFDLVSTTLAGYTAETSHRGLPDLKLLSEVVRQLSIPVLAEGQITSSEQLVACFARGAYAAVVGGAITRPQLITKRFVEAFRQWQTSVKIQ